MDKSFLPENFLLSNQTSEELYFEFAQAQPIFDYHCHIPPADIAGNITTTSVVSSIDFSSTNTVFVAPSSSGGSNSNNGLTMSAGLAAAQLQTVQDALGSGFAVRDIRLASAQSAVVVVPPVERRRPHLIKPQRLRTCRAAALHRADRQD